MAAPDVDFEECCRFVALVAVRGVKKTTESEKAPRGGQVADENGRSLRTRRKVGTHDVCHARRAHGAACPQHMAEAFFWLGGVVRERSASQGVVALVIVDNIKQ